MEDRIREKKEFFLENFFENSDALWGFSPATGYPITMMDVLLATKFVLSHCARRPTGSGGAKGGIFLFRKKVFP